MAHGLGSCRYIHHSEHRHSNGPRDGRVSLGVVSRALLLLLAVWLHAAFWVSRSRERYRTGRSRSPNWMVTSSPGEASDNARAKGDVRERRPLILLLGPSVIT